MWFQLVSNLSSDDISKCDVTANCPRPAVKEEEFVSLRINDQPKKSDQPDVKRWEIFCVTLGLVKEEERERRCWILKVPSHNRVWLTRQEQTQVERTQLTLYMLRDAFDFSNSFQSSPSTLREESRVTRMAISRSFQIYTRERFLWFFTHKIKKRRDAWISFSGRYLFLIHKNILKAWWREPWVDENKRRDLSQLEERKETQEWNSFIS